MEQKDWDRFDPYTYLEDNYKTVHSADVITMARMVEKYMEIGKNDNVILEVGSGPNLLPILIALPFAKSITVIEYGQINLDYLNLCKNHIPIVFKKWIKVLKYLYPQIYQRFNFSIEIQKKLNINFGTVYALPSDCYDIVSMHYVVESITNEKNQFDKGCKSVSNALVHGGTLMASFMLGSNGYSVSELNFPAIGIEVMDIHKSFGGFMRDLQFIKSKSIRKGYDGIANLIAKKI